MFMKRLRDGIVLPSRVSDLASASHTPRSWLKDSMLTFEGDFKGGEWNFPASLNRARRRQAKSWELRTSTSLARLWHSQGKRQAWVRGP
jgi:hypothetical protein